MGEAGAVDATIASRREERRRRRGEGRLGVKRGTNSRPPGAQQTALVGFLGRQGGGMPVVMRLPQRGDEGGPYAPPSRDRTLTPR